MRGVTSQCQHGISHGYAVIDSGATKTMGSIHAVEQLMAWNQKTHENHNVKFIDGEDRPTFGFGNSPQSQSLSTCYVKAVRLPGHADEDPRHPRWRGTNPFIHRQLED